MNCSTCGSKLEIVKDFGMLPLSNNLVNSKNAEIKKFPLILCFCEQCELLQLSEKLDSKILFKEDYPYRSGVSKVFKEHCKNFVESLEEIPSSILEIGGNDGTLAKEFLKFNMDYTLVDPCYNEKIENLNGIRDYFSSNLFPEKKFDLIIFQNSFAHIPNPIKLISECFEVLEKGGQICVELPIAEYTIKNNFWETVYFEHQFYYSVGALKKLFKRVLNFNLVKIQNFEHIQGGSSRLFFSANPSNMRKYMNPTRVDLYNIKKSLDVFDERRKDLKRFVRYSDKKLIGITAPAKTALLLSLLDEKESEKILFLVDDVKEKQGKFLQLHNRNIEIKPFSEIPSNEVGIIFSMNYERVLTERASQFNIEGVFCP
jgi:SAM-dependent methyltransferase